jgi:MerR family transcriptional regulator, light-induced transcriptional regulator
MRKELREYPDDPLYNMKAMEQQTNISAATLRAWERRYGLVEPKRTASGYRLYSDRDVALLRWVRRQMSDGLTISRVVAIIESFKSSEEPIWIDTDDSAPSPFSQDVPMPPGDFVLPLYQSLISLDTEKADEIIEKAFAMYTMTTVCVDLMVPTLVEIGEAMHNGVISISTEHFASAYLRGRLYGLFRIYPHHPEMPMIMIGCAPSEQHEIGALIFALILRQHGYNVIYLGQDVPVDDIVRTALQERPVMVCMSANSYNTAIQLRHVHAELTKAGTNSPLFCYGGRAFDYDPALRNEVGGYYLGSDPRDAVNLVNNLLRASRTSP